MRLIKRITKKTVTVALIFALSVALLFGAFTLPLFARAEDNEVEDTKEFAATSLNISNPNFTDSSGNYDPTASATSWSGASVGGGNGGGIVHGIIDLTSSNYLTEKCGNKNLHLDQYEEYKDDNVIPKTIFGTELYGGDKKTLFINTKKDVEVAYAYTSSDMTFEANSFYRVSAWVKTGDFASGSGATIKLTGLGENCAFVNINTFGEADGSKYGWVQYTFYVRTSASASKTVKLSLGIGDAVSSDEKGEPTVLPRTAHGYAMFDTVAAHRISAYDFAFETSAFDKTERENVYTDATGTAMALDLYEPQYLTTVDSDEKTIEIGTFSNATLGADGYWNPNVSYNDNAEGDDEIAYVKSADVKIYNSALPIDLDDENEKLSKSPWAPLGRAEYETENPHFNGGNNGNILMISANDGRATRGVASPDVTIERFRFYRMSVWVKGDGVTGGDGISVLVKGENNIPSDKYVLHSAHTSLSGDSSDNAHYGWKEQVFYIQGSSLSDRTVHFEFWLGSPSNPSEGIAMFDNVTFTELSREDYNTFSGTDGGAVITLDPASSETGVTNGNFITLGEYDEVEFPMPVSDWSFYDASNVGTIGFSRNEVNTDKAIHGMIPADAETFDAIIASGKLAGIGSPAAFALPPKYNALLLSSTAQTAFCYRSSAITAAVDKSYKLTVAMAVDGVSDDGYGASLVLKTTDGNVVSTIEGIKTTNNKFETFTFYIDAPLSEKTLYVEIWLGLNDRKDNKQKLSDGNVYVKEVAMTEWEPSDGEFNTLLDKYNAAVSSKAALATLRDESGSKYGIISFNTLSIDYFDAYTYNMTDGLGALPYGWSVSGSHSDGYVSGLYDSDNRKGVELYPGFDSMDESGRMLYIYNTSNNRTKLEYGSTVSLVSNTFYRLDVTLKVRVTDEIRTNDTAIGAGINLTGTVSESFENIKDTTTLISEGNESSRRYETFKTYTFYISTGASGGDVGLNITFGGDNWKSFIQGRLIISNVSLTSMTESAYNDATANLTSQEKKVELSADSTDDDDSDAEQPAGDIAWWLIPTVIFSICLVAAIAIIIIIRLRDRLKKNKKATYTSEYDRSAAAKKLDKLAEGDSDNADEKREEEYSDSDDGETADQSASETEAEEQTAETEADGEENAEATTEEKSEKSEEKKPSDDLDD